MNKDTNVELICKNPSKARYDVVAFGNLAFNKKLSPINAEAKAQEATVEHNQARVSVAEREGSGAEAERKDVEYALRKANRGVKSLPDSHHDIVTGWTALDDPVFGHLVWSPPVNPSASLSISRICHHRNPHWQARYQKVPRKCHRSRLEVRAQLAGGIGIHELMP